MSIEHNITIPYRLADYMHQICGAYLDAAPKLKPTEDDNGEWQDNRDTALYCLKRMADLFPDEYIQPEESND